MDMLLYLSKRFGSKINGTNIEIGHQKFYASYNECVMIEVLDFHTKKTLLLYESTQLIVNYLLPTEDSEKISF